MASTALNVYDYNKVFNSGLKGKEKAVQTATQQANAYTNAKMFKFNHDEAQLERDFNKEQSLAEQKFNREEAATARDWQKMMSDTSHQREVKDLIRAGLNPVLSANTGAQSYTTNAASAHALSATHASGMANSPAGAMGTIAGSYEGARATRYASVQNSSAMRYSANMAYMSSLAQAEAMRDVAETNAATQRYVADKGYASSWPGFLYKAMDGAADYFDGKKTENAVNKFLWQLDSALHDVETKDPVGASKLTKRLSTGHVTVQELLDDYGSQMEIICSSMGINADNQAKYYLAKSFADGNVNTMIDLFYDYVADQTKKGRGHKKSGKSSGRGRYTD